MSPASWSSGTAAVLWFALSVASIVLRKQQRPCARRGCQKQRQFANHVHMFLPLSVLTYLPTLARAASAMIGYPERKKTIMLPTYKTEP